MKYLVVKDKCINILGYTAATLLGIVNIEYDNDPKLTKDNNAYVRIIDSNKLQSPFVTHAELFTNTIGKLKKFQAHLDIDKSIVPCQQPPYPVPFALQAKYDEKLDWLEANDIISKAKDEIPTWVHPTHPVSKFNENNILTGVRITGNCKQMNKATLKRKRYIPAVPELTSQLEGAQ